jgi:hypothetical protein
MAIRICSLQPPSTLLHISFLAKTLYIRALSAIPLRASANSPIHSKFAANGASPSRVCAILRRISHTVQFVRVVAAVQPQAALVCEGETYGCVIADGVLCDECSDNSTFDGRQLTIGLRQVSLCGTHNFPPSCEVLHNNDHWRRPGVRARPANSQRIVPKPEQCDRAGEPRCSADAKVRRSGVRVASAP